jgi:hypothetical protein
MKIPRLSQMLLPAAVAGALVLGGVGVAAAVDDDGGGGEKKSDEKAERHDGRDGRHGHKGGQEWMELRGLLMDDDVRAVLGEIKDEVAKETRGIADRVIDKAVKDDKLTRAQADDLRALVNRFTDRDRGDGPGGHGFGPHGGRHGF